MLGAGESAQIFRALGEQSARQHTTTKYTQASLTPMALKESASRLGPGGPCAEWPEPDSAESRSGFFFVYLSVPDLELPAQAPHIGSERTNAC